MAKRGKSLAALDIGTYKTCALIAEPRDDGQIDVIGVGNVRSEGVRKGAVVNLERTADGIRRAVEEAELMAGVQAERVYVNLGGQHIKGLNSRGVVAVTNKEREVRESDIQRVIEAARAISIPPDREVVHVLPQEFIVDDQDGIGDPLGMTGSRLEVSLHVVTGSRTAVQNVETCVNRAGCEILRMVVSPLAASESVLTNDEKELGVGLLEIGGGTTSLAVFERGSLWHSTVIPTGGDHVTGDVSIGLRTSLGEAERIKRKYGCAMVSMVSEDESVEVTSIGKRQSRVIERRLLAEIVQHRVDEIFRLIAEEIKNAGYERSLNAGFVLSGGASALDGMVEIGEPVLDSSVRLGSPLPPEGVGGLVDILKNPEYAVAVGLLLYGRGEEQKHASQNTFGRAGRLIGGVRGWLKGLF